MEPEAISALRPRLLAWYKRHRRDLPWRLSRDPFSIWVSEVMLQQTRVAVVIDRYRDFLARFPTVVSLSLAREEEVLALWSGLGYYRRARMLHKTAQFLARHCRGNLPVTAAELRALPGIGPYTAAAVASIAHGEQVAVVDGNVERVICRMAGWEAGSRKSGGAALRRKIEAMAAELVDPSRPGDWNQAMMELGAVVCLPRNPRCAACPAERDCVTRGEHKTAPREPMLSREAAYALSVRSARKRAGKPTRGLASREVLLEQRPKTAGVMPGMWELPTLRVPVVPEDELRMALRHSIMRVNYYVRIRTVSEDDVTRLAVRGGRRLWVPLSLALTMALTGLTRKVLSRARLLPARPLEIIAPRRRGVEAG
jgi:A/G-specific adenine glycosylase